MKTQRWNEMLGFHPYSDIWHNLDSRVVSSTFYFARSSFVLISVRGWQHPRARENQTQGIVLLKISENPTSNLTQNLLLVVSCLNQLCQTTKYYKPLNKQNFQCHENLQSWQSSTVTFLSSGLQGVKLWLSIFSRTLWSERKTHISPC